MATSGSRRGHREVSRTAHRKLRSLLIDAQANVPMYRALYEPLGLSPQELADPRVLQRLPILSKAHLLATPAEERVNRRFGLRRLVTETTTGSTGQPFSLCIDRRYRMLRNLRFLRGLLSAGLRPWHRLMLLTDRHPGESRRHNWHYLSVEQPTRYLASAYLGIRPDVLYGFATPLRLLAEWLLQSSKPFPKPRLVVSTAEMLDGATRRALETAFGCPVADFYGMTEMGLVAWQRSAGDGYIMFSNAVLTEFIPDDACRGCYRMIMTNLDLRASPVIRFDSGDLAYARPVNGVLEITAFEGRVIDTIACRDGSELSPYRITDALRDVPGVSRFKVTQRELACFDVDLEAPPSARSQAADRVRAIFDALFGPGLELTFRFGDELIPDGTRKFRPVESQVRSRS